MSDPDRVSLDYWRTRALRLTQRANAVKNPKQRRCVLRLAREYERLAREYEAHALAHNHVSATDRAERGEPNRTDSGHREPRGLPTVGSEVEAKADLIDIGGRMPSIVSK